jgi:thiol-disulfide isomerase/thioredoxin/uncharacterized membrane protein YphA (DoxX/SURF4 family)
LAHYKSASYSEPMDAAVLAARLLLAGIFAVAAVAKLLDIKGSREGLRGFGLTERVANFFGVLLPLAELTIAAALTFEPTARLGGIGAAVLLLAFCVGIGNALRQGKQPDCHCFGQVHSEPASWKTLARNLGLALVAGFVIAEGGGPAIDDWVSARTPAELVSIALGAATVWLAVISLRLRRDKETLRAALENAIVSLDKVPVGLPFGSRAPEFALAAVGGEARTLEQLRAAGISILLLFVDPGCGPCRQLLPDLARWQTALANHLPITVIGIGKRKRLQELSEEHGVHMLVDEDSEVFGAYRFRDTPSAVVVNPDGTIASKPLKTGFEIEGMIRTLLRRGGQGPATPAKDRSEASTAALPLAGES